LRSYISRAWRRKKVVEQFKFGAASIRFFSMLRKHSPSCDLLIAIRHASYGQL
jgi:hypothetical protein